MTLSSRPHRALFPYFYISIICLGALAPGAPRAAAEDAAPVKVTFLFNPGCRECDEIRDLIRRTGEETGIALEVDSLDLTQGRNIEFLWGWEEKTGKKAEPLLGVVIGEEFLAGYEEIKERLRTVLEDYASSRAPPSAPSPLPAGRRSVESEFSRFGPGTVALAGLIDGINPCAFTVLVMLLSFMMVGGLSRVHTLLAGLSFAAAVFLAYLLVGLGLLSAARATQGYRTAADIVYLVVGVVSIVLGAISLYDAAVIRRTGELKDARLKLPSALMNRIQRAISTVINPRHLIVSAFTLGLLVSFLELVCTGQIYFPTIILIMKNASLRARGFLYLLLYCGAFILPLLIVLGAVFWGSRIPRVAEAVGKYAWVSKALTGVIFLALGVFLLIRF
jgi:cytochrome c biogenesis protein CcdA